jgi:hypothetical protein
MFSLYISPSVRYGALPCLEVIHLAKYDIIGMAEGDSTHYLIALPVLCHAKLLSTREKVAVACEIATKARSTPSCLFPYDPELFRENRGLNKW